jgi:hypothetical protein
VDSEGRTIWIVDAHRGDDKWFVVRADEKLKKFPLADSVTKLWVAKQFTCASLG